MKKLFFAIYFIGIFAYIMPVLAGTREVGNPIEFEKIKSNSNRPTKRVINDEIPTTADEFADYIRERAEKAVKMPQSVIEQNSGMSIIHSGDFLSQQAQENKSTFQKIYEEALNKVSLDDNRQPADILPSNPMPSDVKLRSELALQQAQPQPDTFDFDIINVELPNGETITAPAKEHIPYLSSRIDILPNGLVRVRETVTVIANGEKLRYGLSKALPKFSISREGIKNSTIPYLNNVKINGVDIDYTLKDQFDRFLITPKKQFPLQPGIYTYVFDYMLDRKLWYYGEFNEFYWDVTGSFWNLAITKAIATVRLPVNVKSLGQTLMLGYLPDGISEENTVMTINKQTNSLGFTALRPLFAGEGMHMLVRIPKTGFIDPDFNVKFKWFMEDYGDILFAALGLLVILAAYFISWKNIDHSAADNAKIKFQRTPALYRMLAKGVFDKTSFGAFLLDMYKRGIIDIQKEDKNIKLIKKTDSLSHLSSLNRKAVHQIFNGKSSELVLNAGNALKLKRAYKLIEKDTYKSLKWLLLKLNSGYVLFSCLMVLISELAMVYMNVDMWSSFGVLVAATITIAFYWAIFHLKAKNKILRIALRVFALILIGIAVLLMTIHIHFVSAILIVTMICTIFTYSKLFAKREGLIRHNINEAKNLGETLVNDAEKIILGHRFAQNQATIYALDAARFYPKSAQTATVYKLDIIPEVISFL